MLQHLYSRIDSRPSRRTLLRFGATLLAASAVAAALLGAFGGDEFTAITLIAFGFAMAISSVIPGLGRIVYVAWLGLGVTLGLVTSPLVLGLLYFLVFTPTAILRRLLRRDAMCQRLEPGRGSYWEPYPTHQDKSRYIRQF